MTPSIDFWKHLARNWIHPFDFEDDQKLYGELIEIASEVVFLHGRNDVDLYEMLIATWGDRLRMSSEFLNKEEIRRLLNCLREGWPHPVSIQEGIWDHFKGGVYKVHSRIVWAGDEGGEAVIYTSLITGSTCGKLVTSWNELVLWPDGAYRTRFVRRKDPKDPPLFKVPSPDGIA